MTIGTIKGSAVGLALLGGLLLTVLVASRSAAADAYDIHVILPLTGGASFLGQSEQQSLRLAQERVNVTGGIGGRPLNFIFHDDQSSPQTAVQLTGQVTASHPTVMFGSALVAMCNAMAPLVQSGPVMYCLSPGVHPVKGSYVFTTSVSTHDLANALVRYFRMKGWTKLAVMTSTDATGQDAERGIDETVALPENREVKIVARAHFNTTDVTVSAQIETIKAAQPQAFIAWSTGAPIATIFKGIIQADIDIPIATTDGNMTYAQMAQYAEFLPRQLYIPAAEWSAHAAAGKLNPAVAAAQDSFHAAYRAAGKAPDVAAAHGWDPVMIVVDGLRKLGPNAGAAQLRDHIAGLSGFAGNNGIYDFERVPQRGLDVADAVVTRWDRAQKTWVPVSGPTGVPLDQ